MTWQGGSAIFGMSGGFHADMMIRRLSGFVLIYSSNEQVTTLLGEYKTEEALAMPFAAQVRKKWGSVSKPKTTSVGGSHFLASKRFGPVGIFNTSFDMRAQAQEIKGIGVYCNQEKIKMLGGEFEEGDIIKI